MEDSARTQASPRTALADAKYEDLAAALTNRLKRDRDKVVQQMKDLKREEQKVEEKHHDLEDLEERILSISDGVDDVVELNVGGEIMCTTRAVLCSAEGSLLAGMFSGNFDNGHKLDKEGRVFLDYDPQLFARVLSHLRLRRIATLDSPAPYPQVKEEVRAEYDMMVKYFGLENFMFDDVGSVNICKRIAELSNVSESKLQTHDLMRIALSSTGGVPSVNHEEVFGENGVHERSLENSYGATNSTIQLTFVKHRVRVEAIELRAKLSDVGKHMSSQWEFRVGSNKIQMEFPFSRAQPWTGRLEAPGLGSAFADVVTWTFAHDFCLEHIILYGRVLPK